jgi:hypothetical protein
VAARDGLHRFAAEAVTCTGLSRLSQSNIDTAMKCVHSIVPIGFIANGYGHPALLNGGRRGSQATPSALFMVVCSWPAVSHVL